MYLAKVAATCVCAEGGGNGGISIHLGAYILVTTTCRFSFEKFAIS